MSAHLTSNHVTFPPEHFAAISNRGIFIPVTAVQGRRLYDTSNAGRSRQSIFAGPLEDFPIPFGLPARGKPR